MMMMMRIIFLSKASPHTRLSSLYLSCDVHQDEFLLLDPSAEEFWILIGQKRDNRNPAIEQRVELTCLFLIRHGFYSDSIVYWGKKKHFFCRLLVASCIIFLL